MRSDLALEFLPFRLDLLNQELLAGRQTAVEDALAAVDKTGERTYEEELYRLKGEFVLESGPQSKLSTARKSSKSKARNPKPGIQKGSGAAVRSLESEAEGILTRPLKWPGSTGRNRLSCERP